MGQGKPEALAHCLTGVWGRLHAVVVAATVSVCVCVCVCMCVRKCMCASACAHVRERTGRKERREGEWLALEGGGGGLEMERAVAHGKRRRA